jgi:S-adenosylmethionine-diacylglycerol 3-amino-3-carboxypropyl transferase
MAADDRSGELTQRFAALGLPADALGPPELVAKYGPDHCGRYEWLFARLRELLVERADEIRSLMLLSDPIQQAQRVAPGTDLGDAIEAGLAETMELSRLVRIFGPDATANRVQPFAEHFLEQTRKILGTMPAADNPFLHQIFLGSFIRPLWPWLSSDRHDSLPETKYSHATMDEVLQALPARSYDLIHLSNILDWIKPTEARRILGNTLRCLSPGGLVVIRQLNSQLDIPGIPSGFQWMRDLSDQLHRSDRSFFYRSLHVGMKP